MNRRRNVLLSNQSLRRWVPFAVPLLIIACAASGAAVANRSDTPATPVMTSYPGAPEPATSQVSEAQILRGRTLVLHHGCGDCHGGYANPTAEGWLAGRLTPEQEYQIGPFKTYARNITPDNATGIGRFSERQIFNALRYGLRPGETPDVEITSTVPGEGNHPASPKYLAPPMPWPAFRNMSDQELRDIAAYVKNGVLPVSNRVPDSEGPPDFWASAYTVERIGTYPAPPFPTARERRP